MINYNLFSLDVITLCQSLSVNIPFILTYFLLEYTHSPALHYFITFLPSLNDF